MIPEQNLGCYFNFNISKYIICGPGNIVIPLAWKIAPYSAGNWQKMGSPLVFNPNPAGLFGRSTGRGGEESTRIYIDVLQGLFLLKPFKKWFQIKILVFLIIRNSFPSFYFVSFFHETVPKSATFSEKIFGKKSGQIPPPPVGLGLTKWGKRQLKQHQIITQKISPLCNTLQSGCENIDNLPH